jgi:hypothetical protein
MRQWAFNTQEQVDMCVELERELDVPDWLMTRVHKRRQGPLVPTPQCHLPQPRGLHRRDTRRPRRGRERVPDQGRSSRGSPPQAPPRGAQGRERCRLGAPCAGARPAGARVQEADVLRVMCFH